MNDSIYIKILEDVNQPRVTETDAWLPGDLGPDIIEVTRSKQLELQYFTTAVTLRAS